ncbi:MAG: hypothetical protein L6R37_006726 [Teloschistes peruensis]|nr:MAG: hypothetical protein L6R37_006726 [Teloschistes peruensis]
MCFQPMRLLASILTATALLSTPLMAEPIPAVSLNPAHLSARALEKRHDCHGSAYCGSAGKQQVGNAITAMNFHTVAGVALSGSM